jgi:hypothetical protein
VLNRHQGHLAYLHRADTGAVSVNIKATVHLNITRVGADGLPVCSTNELQLLSSSQTLLVVII